MEASIQLWSITLFAVIVLILIDLLAHRGSKITTSVKASAWETAIWTGLGLGFGGVVFLVLGSTASGEYFAGYLLERMLSVDNVFVFVVILSYFAVPIRLQHRALLFGVITALVLRAIFIFGGIAILERLTWTEYVFGFILLYTAYKLFTNGDQEQVEPEHNIALRVLRKIVPVTNTYQDHKILIRLDNPKRWAATPLFAVLLVLGTTDLIFAIDSIPAIFAVTRDSYVIFTSNAFALLGLRSMSILLARVMDRFVYLKHALAIVLGIVGLKMIAGEIIHISVWIMLIVIAVILGAGVGYSIFATRQNQRAK